MTTAPAPTRHDTKPATPPANWQARGACRQEDPELFFPLGTTGPALTQIEEAKAVCRRCPVLGWCREWALETRQDSGVWGGLSEDERYALQGRTRGRRRTDGLTATDHILRNRLGEFRALEASGLGDLVIAQRLGTNVQTINRVRARLAEEVNTA